MAVIEKQPAVCNFPAKIFSELAWQIDKVKAVGSRFFAYRLLYD